MKRHFTNQLVFIAVFGLLISCSSEEDPITGTTPSGTSGNNNEWLIPTSEVLDGGPGKDGIPSIDQPVFVPAAEADFVEEDELVVGFKNGNVARAYPHSILDWHEIVNDELDALPVAITYCPLTGTAVGWNRIVDGNLTTFGVSGLLHQTNLMPYDRATNSTWSQMRLDCVNGPLINATAQTEQLIETTWSTWKSMYPDSEVLSRNTGFNRDYNRYPYGNYKTSNDLFFPINNDNEELHRKERVLGVLVNNRAAAYPIVDFAGDVTKVVTDNVGGREIVVFGNEGMNMIAAYENKIGSESPGLEFRPVNGPLGEAVLTDNEGNEWNVFGEAIAGPRAGQQLNRVVSFVGFWFAWATFYPNIELYGA